MISHPTESSDPLREELVPPKSYLFKDAKHSELEAIYGK